jgi:hypothetical protein
MTDIFNITHCNVAQLIAESNRFLFQVLLVHIATCVIEGKKEIFTETLFKTLLITAMAIFMYHIFFRKIVEPKLEKMKSVCSRDYRTRKEKIKKAHRRDPLRPKYRRRRDRKLNEYDTESQDTESSESSESSRSSKESTEIIEVSKKSQSRGRDRRSKSSQDSERRHRSDRRGDRVEGIGTGRGFHYLY